MPERRRTFVTLAPALPGLVAVSAGVDVLSGRPFRHTHPVVAWATYLSPVEGAPSQDELTLRPVVLEDGRAVEAGPDYYVASVEDEDALREATRELQARHLVSPERAAAVRELGGRS